MLCGGYLDCARGETEVNYHWSPRDLSGYPEGLRPACRRARFYSEISDRQWRQEIALRIMKPTPRQHANARSTRPPAWLSALLLASLAAVSCTGGGTATPPPPALNVVPLT